MADYSITPLVKNDIDSIVAVWESSVLATHTFLTPSEIRFYKPLVKKFTLSELFLYGIRNSEKKLSGFIGLSSDKIEMLFVAPEFFGQGIGSALINFAIGQGFRKVDVNEENLRAVQFYTKHGFNVFSRDELDDCGKPHPILHLRLD